LGMRGRNRLDCLYQNIGYVNAILIINKPICLITLSLPIFTVSTEQRICEPNDRSAKYEMPYLLWKPRVHHRVPKKPNYTAPHPRRQQLVGIVTN
jgi:hypothetical protein